MPKLRVVIFVEYYLPGFLAGGPIRSVSALVDQVGEEIDFYILTRDRDEGSSSAYPDTHEGEWKSVGRAKVRYLAPREITARRLGAVVREVQPDAVYLNGVFGPMSRKFLIARRLGGLNGIRVLLAPRGELSPGALMLGAFKKRSFLRLSRVLGLHRDVVFHASTARESEEISRTIPTRAGPRIARNPVSRSTAHGRGCSKVRGAVRFVYLSRVARKKNLHVAIDFLRSLKGSVEFEIYGPLSEPAYWRDCQMLIGQMPPNVRVTYRGALVHDLVGPTLSAHHFFLFPTASENFGHVIVEALLAGCPVITSDQTPWLGLAERGIGWDLPLDDTTAWRELLQTCVDMDAEAHRRLSQTAKSFGNTIAATDTAAENANLFRSIVERVPADSTASR